MPRTPQYVPVVRRKHAFSALSFSPIQFYRGTSTRSSTVVSTSSVVKPST